MKLKRYKEFVNESSGYTKDSEGMGLYDQMTDLLVKVEELLGEMPNGPEEALEMLSDNDVKAPTFRREELADAIETLQNEIDSVEAETYYSGLEEGDEQY